MHAVLMGKLNARRKNLIEENDKGFTLIELLVVVIIIGILAAIAIPVYLGVQASSKDAGVKSDLTNAKTAMVSYQTDNGGFLPTAAATQVTADSLTKYGYTQGDTTTSIKAGAAITATSTTFCLVAPSATDSAKFYTVTDSGGVSKTAVAAASLVAPCK